MPALTFNHGSGANTHAVSKMLRNFLSTLPRVPTGVLVIEAHAFGTAGRGVAVSGDAALCDAVASLLPDVSAGRVSGHGVSDCVRAFQGVPIAAMSLRGTEDAVEHLAMGAAIAPLRSQGVLIVGSGVPSIHNFDVLFHKATRANIDKSFEFDEWLTTALAIGPMKDRLAQLERWEGAPGARVCHSPGASEHFFPTLVVAGAAGEQGGVPCFPETHATIIGVPKERLRFPARHYVFA